MLRDDRRSDVQTAQASALARNKVAATQTPFKQHLALACWLLAAGGDTATRSAALPSRFIHSSQLERFSEACVAPA